MNRPSEPLPVPSESTRLFEFRQNHVHLLDGAWLDLITSDRLGVCTTGTSSPLVTCGPVACAESMSTNVSPSTPAVARLGVSLCIADLYSGRRLMITSTGVSFRPGTIMIFFTLPMVTPCRFTGAPGFRPGSVLKVGVHDDVTTEDSARAARHQGDQHRERSKGDNDQDAHLQL